MANLDRINAALKWINDSDKVADIGCDHGYLGIEAVKKGVKLIQFVDNKSEPLESARINYLNSRLDKSYAKFSLSSGLDDLDKNVNTVCIMGMGGELIARILNDNLEKVRKLDKIILEANTKIPNLRNELDKLHLNIIDEQIIYSNSKYYELILCDNNYNKPLTNEDFLFGPILRKNKSEIFINKWMEIYHKYDSLIKNNNKINDDVVTTYHLIKGELNV